MIGIRCDQIAIGIPSSAETMTEAAGSDTNPAIPIHRDITCSAPRSRASR